MLVAAKVENQKSLLVFGYFSGVIATLSVVIVIAGFAYGSQMEIPLSVEMRKKIIYDYVSETSASKTRWYNFIPTITYQKF